MKGSFVDSISLRNRIFVSILLVSLISSVLVAVSLTIQYSNQAKAYHKERFHRRELTVLEHLHFIINKSNFILTSSTLPIVLKEEIVELSTIHDVQIDLFDLEGNLLLSSKNYFIVDDVDNSNIPDEILENIRNTKSKRWEENMQIDQTTYQTSYQYITDNRSKNLGIVRLPYKATNKLYEEQMRDFIIRFGQVFLFMIVLSIVVSFWLSRTITSTLQRITNIIVHTRLNQKNQKLSISGVSREVRTLIAAYNRMVEELERSAEKLAKSERENAWREMARQVAHEIKNPLTPMRLTIQMFERNFDPSAENYKEEVKEFSETLIQQIDTMTAVASAFSTFASMPTVDKKECDVVPIIRRAVEVFYKKYIHFETNQSTIVGCFDTTQITRIITNLVKNAVQATKEKEQPFICVRLEELPNERIKITVQDNGVGIPEENKERIFEPKFTTKTKGMGLGLAMIKNIIESNEGTISVTSENHLTTFIVELPKK